MTTFDSGDSQSTRESGPLLIPAHVEALAPQILERIDQESIDVYRFLADRYASYDPKDDLLFQFVFRSFYRLDNAGLGMSFKRRFFELFSAARSNGSVDIASVVRELHTVHTLRGLRSLQFSFATKLAATVNPTSPIYDAEVAAVFGFRSPGQYKPFELRLREYLVFQARLQALYDRIVSENLLVAARDEFRNRFQCSADQVPEHKVLDFFFWAAGKVQRSKAPGARAA